MNDIYKKSRIAYLDNLKVLLTALVIIDHAAITYGPVGFWYFRQQTATSYPLAFIISLLQTFMIGLFFLIAAYFIIPSYNRKTPVDYFYSRLKKLGIPVILYMILISPLLAYISQIREGQKNFLTFYVRTVIHKQYITPGPLWFLQALLVFTITYLVIKAVGDRYLSSRYQTGRLNFPSNLNILLFILGLAALSFLTRIWFPIGTATGNLQLSFVFIYLALFVLGIISYRNHWLKNLNRRQALLWLILAAVFIPLWPVIMAGANAFSGNAALIYGGFNWQSAAYSLWESVVGMGLTMGLLYLFREKINLKTKFTSALSASAYAAIIVHPVIVVLLSFSLIDVNLGPILKFLLVSAAAVPLCFTAGFLLKKIPAVKHIL
ncbi:MAG: acyltransferase [Actinomycetia bacterium]|nr:acyltransferase [Actinomycetes bacterium]